MILAVTFVVATALIGVAAARVFATEGGANPAVLGGSAQNTSADQGRGHQTERRAGKTAADGQVRDGVTVFNNGVPAVTKLDPTLLDALRRAATDAAADDVAFYVNSGWRSPEYQEQLLQQAIAKYGSVEEASRWVASPEKSEHVSGNAVDLGPTTATDWLSDHGAAYGLCQIYRNEPWHFELRIEAIDRRCPPMYADPTQDPRLQ